MAILIKCPFKKIVKAQGAILYQTNFKPEGPYEEGNSRMAWDRVYGTWDYRPPWPYGGVTDFTRYKNIIFLEEGGMVMRVEEGEGERYTGARMATMRRTGDRCRAWGNVRFEADMELPTNPYVVGAWWFLTETHLQKKPFWSEKLKKMETERITPEYDWPETSTKNLALGRVNNPKAKFNVACHYGLTHYYPRAKQKNAQFPAVTGRHTWFLEKHSWGMVYGIDDEVKYIQLGGVIPEKIYPIFWITVPDWAPLGFDPEGANMKVHSFKVFELDKNE